MERPCCLRASTCVHAAARSAPTVAIPAAAMVDSLRNVLRLKVGSFRQQGIPSSALYLIRPLLANAAKCQKRGPQTRRRAKRSSRSFPLHAEGLESVSEISAAPNLSATSRRTQPIAWQGYNPRSRFKSNTLLFEPVRQDLPSGGERPSVELRPDLPACLARAAASRCEHPAAIAKPLAVVGKMAGPLGLVAAGAEFCAAMRR